MLQNLHLTFDYSTPSQKVKILQHFVAFSEYINFIKMDADKLADNTQNAPQIFDPICSLKPKSLGFSKQALSGCS